MNGKIYQCPKKGHMITREQCLNRQQTPTFRCPKSCSNRLEPIDWELLRLRKLLEETLTDNRRVDHGITSKS